MSDMNFPTEVTKKKYKSRKSEFYDLSIEQIKQKITETTARMAEIKADPTKAEEYKELNHYRIRAYARIRKITPTT